MQNRWYQFDAYDKTIPTIMDRTVGLIMEISYLK